MLNRKFFIFVLFLILPAAQSIFAGQDQQIRQKLAALEKIQGKFNFIVVGDNRTGDEIYRVLVNMIMVRKPAFVINTGDMITTPGDMKQWAGFWEISKPITVPYFLTVGNHDAHPEVKSSEKIYREQVDLPGNELYYSFTAGNSLFVVIDSFLAGQEKKITGEQFQWLERVLSGSGQKHRFVFVHHPLYPEKGKGKHYGNSLDRYKDDRDKLQALFRKYKVRTVFTGHEHMYLRKNVDAIHHVITGGGGAPLYTEEAENGFYHFVQVTVDGANVQAEVVDMDGKVRDRF